MEKIYYVDFADKIKAKYPEYSEADPYDLATRMIQKYPEYKEKVSFAPVEQGLIPQGPVSTFGPLAKLGLEKVAEKAADFGPAGGVVGVPALIAANLVPESDAMAVAQIAGIKALKELGKAVKLPKSGKEARTLAQFNRSQAAIPERTTQAVLKRLDEGVNVLKSAKSVEEATEDYVRSIPGLRNVTESLHERLGKSVPTLGDYSSYLDDILVKAKSPQGASPQEVLDAIQATNKILGHREFPKDPDIVRGLLDRKNDLIDLLDQAYPKFKRANQALRDAHLKDEFSSLFPRNRNMSVNQLRGFLTTAANAASAAASLTTGNPIPLASSLALTASTSPKVLGKIMSARAALGSDVSLPGLPLSGLAKRAAKATTALVKP